MIELCVKEYCQNCPGFTPETDSYKLFADDRSAEYSTKIYCKYAARCANIAKHLEKEVAKQYANRQQQQTELDD